MKLIVDSTQLYKVCQAAAKAIPSKALLPIHEYLLIEADPFEGIIIQSCNDADRSAYTLPSAAVDGDDMSICIHAAQLISILREIPAQPISIESKDRIASIVWGNGNGKATLPLEDPAIFPVPSFAEQASAKISADTLRDIIDRVHFAVTEDELRPVMSSILFHFTEGKLVCVGTDGHRLVRYTIDSVGPNVNGEPNMQVPVPRRAANMLKTFVEETMRTDKDADVTMAWNSNDVSFSSLTASVTFRLGEGRYPNYNSVIPKNSPMNAIVNRTSLIGAVRRVSALSSKLSSLIKLTFKDGELTVQGEDIDYSTSGEESVPVQVTGTERMVIGVKGSYFVEVLQHLTTDEVVIEGTDATRALLFTGVDDERQLLMLLMPMQLNN